MASNQLNQDIQSRIDQTLQARPNGTIGVIMDYDSSDNTATVAITENNSNDIRDILKKVPCPLSIGIQQVAPEPGKLCWVAFSNGTLTQPLIVNLYNHQYNKYDYHRQTTSQINVPQYLLEY